MLILLLSLVAAAWCVGYVASVRFVILWSLRKARKDDALPDYRIMRVIGLTGMVLVSLFICLFYPLYVLRVYRGVLAARP